MRWRKTFLLTKIYLRRNVESFRLDFLCLFGEDFHLFVKNAVQHGELLGKFLFLYS